MDSYRLTGTTSLNSASNPRSWDLYGSENEIEWNILDTQRNKFFFNVDSNTQAYKLNAIPPDDNWGQYADLAQQTLQMEYWNKNNENYSIHRNTPVNYGFNYWWMAHVLDVLVDGYNRTSDENYKIKINNLYLGVFLFRILKQSITTPYYLKDLLKCLLSNHTHSKITRMSKSYCYTAL